MIEEAESTSYKDVPRGPHGHWLPGRSANPAGRAKGGQSITHALLRRLEREPTLAEKLADKMIEHFEAGNAVALKQVWDRLDGTVTEKQLIERVEAGELSEDALIAAGRALERKRARDSENLPSTMDVEAPLGENRSFDMGKDSEGL